MAGSKYRCAVCALAILPALTKTGEPSKRQRKYCSPACKVKARPQRKHALSKPKLIVCRHCFAEKHRRVRGGDSDAGKYCSRECAFARRRLIGAEVSAIRRIGQANRPVEGEQEGAQRRAHVVRSEVAALRRIAMYVPRPSLYSVVCESCQQEFQAIRRPKGGVKRKTCDECKRIALKEQRRAYKKTENGRKRKRLERAARRAVERGTDADRIDPIDVFRRDGWRCHMCGKATPERLRGTYHPQAPELDHIVTLADGGTHTWGNVACACRACNGSKGARSMGQMGLELAA